jgi:predicted DsbA family dithiol-disulfide isomerase
MKPIKIEVFSSPGCSKCGHAKEMLRKMVAELETDRIVWREINILDELDYSVKMGVLSTPAIAIDNELVFSGLPSSKKLHAYIESKLKQNTIKD